MPTCPRCHTLVEADALQCPHCRLDLKAFGHPGIPLHRAEGETSLCETCLYHLDDTCNFPQRPTAQTCTLYQSPQPAAPPAPYRPSRAGLLQAWGRRHGALLLLLGILGISLLLAIAR